MNLMLPKQGLERQKKGTEACYVPVPVHHSDCNQYGLYTHANNNLKVKNIDPTDKTSNKYPS